MNKSPFKNVNTPGKVRGASVIHASSELVLSDCFLPPLRQTERLECSDQWEMRSVNAEQEKNRSG